MPPVAARSIVLQSFPFSDTSKILRLYTEDHGLRSALAKGALRPRSRYSGLLDTFTEGTAHLYLREGRDLQTLGGFDLLVSRQALGKSLTGFAGASLLAEMLMRFGTDESNPPLFSVLASGLDTIMQSAENQRPAAVFAAVWQLVALLGYAPELESCVSCGTALRPGDPARFDAPGGGVACSRCRPSGRVVDAQTRAELRQWVFTPGDHAPKVPTNPALQSAILRVFLAAHLARDRPLRSLDLFLRAG